jgi:signal peptidase I
MSTRLRRLGESLSTAVLLLAVLAVVLLVAVPRVTGGVALTVLTGSMSPTIPAGSVVLVQPRDPATIDTGDVITFQPAPGATYVTHRVVETRTDASGRRVFVTRGDANPTVDREPVAEAAVAGTVDHHLPYIGYATQYIDLYRALVIIGGLVLLGLVVSSLSGRRTDPDGRSSGDERGAPVTSGTDVPR